MNTKKKVFLFVLFFLVGMLLVFSFQAVRVITSNTVFLPQKTTISLQPPTNAYNAHITQLAGDVKKQGRDADDFSPVASGAAVVQGEFIKTGNGSTTLTFAHITQIQIGQNAEVAFIDGIPAEFLIQQKSGKVTYTMLDDTKSVSVRSLHMLLQVSGKATVTTDPNAGQVVVEMQFGNGKIGINDVDDNTHVFQLAQGQKATIDDATREVDVE